MGILEQFKTDADLEKNGIVLDYGTDRVTIRRNTKSNKQFTAAMRKALKPHRRAAAMNEDYFDAAKAERLMHPLFAEHVVVSWETNVDNQFKKGINPKLIGSDKKTLLPFNTANVIAVFEALPEFFDDLQAQAGTRSLFLEDVKEAEKGN